jgi:predicted ATPase/transcriptional regulator with XRE-family HTH domain
MSTEGRTFHAWIKQRRRALDLTQEDLADCVGCSTTTIQKIELGERRPSKQVAQRLAECLKIPADRHDDFVRYARREAGAGELFEGHGASPASPQPAEDGRINRANPTNLPSPLTPLLGREKVVAAARGYLLREDIRLLTFTGAPGIGKTRLSLQVGSDLSPYFPDGAFFVELAPITDPSRVGSGIAATFGLAESGSGTVQSDLKNYLSAKKMLLVLDAAPLVVDLLSHCLSLKVLVTSREALYVPGEQQFPVPPLDLPDLERLPAVSALPGYPAIALFLDRANSVDPAFSSFKENAPDVTTVCTRLEGIPLAIELAAARVRLFSTAEMSARLDRQLSLLANPTRRGHFQHLPARQQTMRAAIDWSYRLLEAEEQELLSRLGVFVGGWTLEAGEGVCGLGAADGVESLLAKNLVKRVTGGDESRFTMLESIREYALEELEASGEIEEIRRRHALYFLDLVELAEPHLTGADQAMWFQRLEREHSNMVAAMSWSRARGEEDTILRFGAALETFWTNRYPLEGRWWAEGVLKWGVGEPSHMRARALTIAALMLRKTREYSQARAMLEESLRMYRALDDSLGIAASLRWLAIMMWEMDLPGERALVGLMLEESLQRLEAVGDSKGVADMLATFAEMARGEGDYHKAVDGFEKSLVILREGKDKQRLASHETNLAYVLYHCAEYDRMKVVLRESLGIFRELASAFEIAWALVAWAGAVRAQGDAHKAATLIGAANALAAGAGTPFDPNDQRDSEEIEAAIKADVSEEEWQRGQDEGREMSLDEAVAYALSDNSA